MRIALVSQEYPPETAHGGIGTQTYRKARGLAARGHQIHVISHSKDQKGHESFRDGVHVIRIPNRDGEMDIQTDPVRWLTYSTEVARALQRLHAEQNLELVDFPDWASEGYVHLLNQTEWNHIPSVVHLHGPLVMFAKAIGWPALESEAYRVGRNMEETCLRLADAIFSSSRCSAAWCVREYGLNAAQVPVIHTGIDTQLFRPLQIPKEPRPTIVFVGKIAANKGVGLLFDAACHLAKKYPDLCLRLVGRGNDNLLQQLNQQAEKQGFPQLLEVAGFVESQKLPEELSRAHIFAAPSRYEGGPGFVYLEAMACGLPVIACDGSGAAEVVTHDQTGLLVPPDDVDALTAALNHLLKNTEERVRLGTAARKFVLKEADAEICLQRLESFYAQVVHGPAKEAAR